ncbi:MAG: xanthine dehydrogenase accessory protein XdhC [Myxococcota bacterium]|nr:xanthine dehydrogenase accessory protein XdhC [Deltaproteobacteria bacterium]MDQ3338078.1 xanthine dehydrogenase accessory protein XdhC [Myxococcota bacterium]
MSPRLDIFAAALRALDDDRRGVAIATVIGVSGSTPRHLGARLCVAADGTQWGTIGGGKIEQVVVDAAREVARGAESRVVQKHLVRDLAMCCGGSMEIVVTPATREVLAVTSGVLVTPIDGGPIVVRAARDDDPPAHAPRVIDGALVERVGISERAILFGLGHVARALGPLLERLGFEVVVCDDGDTGMTEQPAWAQKLVESFDVDEVARELGGFTASDRILIITRDHAIDQQLLEKLITRDEIGYLGMIGSRGKVGRFRKRLEAKGLYDEARWARLRAPIGIDIGAETPEEIAVAIAAELVALRRRGAASVGSWS